MEFFGLTTFGASDPVKFLMRPEFIEPDTPPDMKEVLKKDKFTHPFVEVIRDLDIYSGVLDGYSYKQYHRLIVGRNKGFYKSIGPKDMYRDSITGSMDYGWFLNDPELKGKTWYKKDSYWPTPWSERTKFLNAASLIIKNYTL